MQQHKNGFIAFHAFLSTSTNRDVALQYVRGALRDPDITPVLFEMEINEKEASCPYASINGISCYPSECEVLFSMHTVFRIGNFHQDENNLWIVRLKLTGNNDFQIQRLTRFLRREVQGPTGWHRLGQLMVRMGRWERAKNIYQILLEKVDEMDTKELAFLHSMLGTCSEELGSPFEALEHYEEALDIKLTSTWAENPELATIYSNIGCIFRQLHYFDKAWEYFQRALELDLKAFVPDREAIAISYSNIGDVYRAQEQLDEAMLNFQKALHIQKECLSTIHPALGTTYANIGSVYRAQHNYRKALLYQKQSLHISEKTLPFGHPSLAIIHHNIAITYNYLDEDEKAKNHAKKAVDIACYSLPQGHLDRKRYLDTYEALS
ncbi:unnamed protein product [Rotaria sp. Silwood2]|nr:unnamed protein product [Rotaria sp. Silwood2]CAF4273189.1 unnamed protein product [Rotaria sp. Silwood2]